MSTPKLTNAERRARRSAAARKGIEARNRKALAQAEAEAQAPPVADPFAELADRIGSAEPGPAGRLALDHRETADEAARKLARAEAKRRENLRAVISKAQEIRRESDLYHMAHSRRWPFKPIDWTPEQIDTAARFLQAFVGPDGHAQADPIRRRGKWRL